MKIKWKQAMTVIALMSSIMLAIPEVSGAAAADREQIPSWASAEIAVWKELGLLKGNQYGEIMPDASVKKSEFVTFINRIFNFSEQSDQPLKDVPEDAWFASEIRRAVAAGVIVGDGSGVISPLEELTREQAALMLYRVFQVPEEVPQQMPFTDDADISPWAKDAVYAMKAGGYVKGMPDGTFLPKKALTRAEAVKMLNNVMGKLIADAGVHADIAGGNLVVNVAGATLSNMNLTGNLYITPGVGEGDLTILNAHIDGTVYVNGGGVHSITLKDSKAKRIVIRKPASPVRVVLSGTSAVENVDVYTGSQVDNDTANGIGTMNVLAGTGITVGVSGPVRQLNLNGSALLNVGASRIDDLLVSEQAGGGRITLGAGAVVANLTANAGVQVDGEGDIDSATINAANVTLAKMPNKLTLLAKEANIGGKVVTKEDAGSTPVAGNPDGSKPVTNPANPGGSDSGAKLYTYAQATSKLGSSDAEILVKQYIAFLQDPTYKPSEANPTVSMPDFANAVTFVDSEFTVKPSIFASLRAINTSVLDSSGTTLWIGTDSGVTRITLSDNVMKTYTKAGRQLKDDHVLLLIADGNEGVFAITEKGVSHIYQ